MDLRLMRYVLEATGVPMDMSNSDQPSHNIGSGGYVDVLCYLYGENVRGNK